MSKFKNNPLTPEENKKVADAWIAVSTIEKGYIYSGVAKASPWLPEKLGTLIKGFEILVRNYNERFKD